MAGSQTMQECPELGVWVMVRLQDDQVFIPRQSAGFFNGAGHILCRVPDSDVVVPWLGWRYPTDKELDEIRGSYGI